MLSKKIRNILSFAVIAALFVSVGYWSVSTEHFLDTTKEAVDESTIDYYALNAHSLQFLPDGKLQYEIISDKIEHLQSSEVTLMTKPDLKMYRGTACPWRVTSEHGEVNPKGTEIELIDSVHVARTNEKNRTTIITSSRMTVFPHKQYAQTEQDVNVIVDSGGVISGKGMKAYLKDGRVDLLSNARGQYESH